MLASLGPGTPDPQANNIDTVSAFLGQVLVRGRSDKRDKMMTLPEAEGRRENSMVWGWGSGNASGRVARDPSLKGY